MQLSHSWLSKKMTLLSMGKIPLGIIMTRNAIWTINLREAGSEEASLPEENKQCAKFSYAGFV